ncbi:GDP-6-deoxy-D-mannose reductase [Mycolicibacterium aichiense]|uniref:GDP-6-deoxy-D-mannose reductase n=1 Tax=Mycolicibacterium aichiense TaxID=1799 RepID=A0AAD1HR29_9MYCO|nr:GDP-6-deoxy-D-mannose reductase [Mycolicibacterium aichiense]
MAANAAGYLVRGVARTDTVPASTRELLTSVHVADLRREWPVGLIGDAVVHLAGLAAVGPSFEQPQTYIEANSAMVTNLCEAHMRADAVSTRILGISTGAVYRPPHNSESLREDADVVASSPYVVSKLLVERQFEYYRRRGLRTIVARPFNHIGPGQRPGFIVPDLVASLEDSSSRDRLAVGNLTTRRDYTDVRDVADAYVRIIASDTPHTIYNVASGKSVSGHDILEAICRTLGRPTPELMVDPARMRPTDARDITGDAGRLRRDLGWSPTIPLESSIADFVSAERIAQS